MPSCFLGENVLTDPLPESWQDLDCPFDARGGKSAIAQLCRMVDDRKEALSGVRFDAGGAFGVAPIDTKPAEYDYDSDPTTSPVYHNAKALEACIDQIAAMLVPVSSYTNGGILHPSTCKRWAWSGLTGVRTRAVFLSELSGLDWKEPEDWEPIIVILREWLDWMSGGYAVAAGWRTDYGSGETYTPQFPPLTLPPVDPPVVLTGGLNPSPGYDYTESTGLWYTDKYITSEVRRDGKQSYDQISWGVSAGGNVPGAFTCDIGMGFSDADNVQGSSFYQSDRVSVLPPGHPTPDPAVYCPFGWWEKSQSTKRFWFRLRTVTGGTPDPADSPNTAVLAALNGKTLSWTAELVEGGQSGRTLSGAANGTCEPASGTIRIVNGAPVPQYVDITATLDDTPDGGDPPLYSNHDDGIQVHKASLININTDSTLLPICLTGCGTYTDPTD